MNRLPKYVVSTTLQEATLMRHGLVDTYRLLVYPVVRGSGKRLFTDAIQATLRLGEAKTFSSGVVALTYQPAVKEGEK